MLQVEAHYTSDYIKGYMSKIAEAHIAINNNQGVLRKDVWDYLMDKYQSNVDHGDFMLSISKLRQENIVLCNSVGLQWVAPLVAKELYPHLAASICNGPHQVASAEGQFVTPNKANISHIDKEQSQCDVSLHLINNESQIEEADKNEPVSTVKQDFMGSEYVRKKDRRYFKEDSSTINGSTMASRLGFTTPAEDPLTQLQRIEQQNIQAVNNQQQIYNNDKKKTQKQYKQEKQQELRRIQLASQFKTQSKSIFKAKKPLAQQSKQQYSARKQHAVPVIEENIIAKEKGAKINVIDPVVVTKEVSPKVRKYQKKVIQEKKIIIQKQADNKQIVQKREYIRKNVVQNLPQKTSPKSDAIVTKADTKVSINIISISKKVKKISKSNYGKKNTQNLVTKLKNLSKASTKASTIKINKALKKYKTNQKDIKLLKQSQAAKLKIVKAAMKATKAKNQRSKIQQKRKSIDRKAKKQAQIALKKLYKL